MKRNIVPLLGIAFVVAIISTGVFYGLFAGKLRSTTTELPGRSIVVASRNLERGTAVKSGDVHLSQLKGTLTGSFSRVDEAVGVTLLEPVKQDEPLLESRLASRDPKAGGAGGGVSAGMRAVSVRVSDSAGIAGLLRAGARVDLQAVLERNGSTELRTILENVEVLAMQPQLEAVGGNRPPVPVMTVLAPARYADLVALADSGARIRVALRNPLDEATMPRRSLALASVFQSSAVSSPAAPQTAQRARSAAGPGQASTTLAASWDHPIQLHVQALGVSAAALGELNSKLTGPFVDNSLRVAAFRPDADPNEVIRSLERKQELEVVSAWRLTAGLGRPISFRAGAAPDQLRVVFSPAAGAGGKVSLRVKPEISLQRSGGVETRKYDANLPDAGSFLVQGLLEEQSDRGILDRLFPGHSWSGRQLVILVTSRAQQQAPASAFAQTHRGQ